MKTMKFLSLAALALTFAACSSNDDELTQQPAEQPANNNMITITAKLAPKSGSAQTRAVSDDGTNIVVDWAANEHIAILYTVGSDKKVADATITAVDGSGVATITFAVDGSTVDGTACQIVYPLSAAKADNSGVKAYADMLAAQDGVLDGDLDVRVGTGTIQTSTPSLTVTTQPEAQFAIFKFTLSGQSIDATHPLVIKKGENDVVTTVTPASSMTSVYVAMPSAASSTYRFIVNSDNNKYIKSGTAAITAGNYYQTPLDFSTARYPLALTSATVDDIGSVVCSDGYVYPAKTAAPSGKTAVGILGKVTATGHGLILALKDAWDQDWNTINGWTSVTSYAGTTLKQLPAGALGSLTSYTTLGATAVSNWAVAQKGDYEAIFINLGSTKSDSDGTTYDANVNAYITTGVGGTALSSGVYERYWSATESGDNAWAFESKYWSGNNDKNDDMNVRPVLGF